MQTIFIEATQKETKFNWGKFMVARWTAHEWQRISQIGHTRLLSEVGWTPNHIMVTDLQTGEGIIVKPGGFALADLEKHKVWVCPMFEPFLTWLYTQDLSDLDKLPSLVELDTQEAAMYGYRRAGSPNCPKCGK
ncbi:hypothetical protein [Acinetobacter sp.]|uniref:hypothetical protein n=1 Tax=Acinetobacter sp. TaxID=472 RepID=UPI0037527DAA